MAFEKFDNFGFGINHVQAVEKLRIDVRAIATIRSFGNVTALHHFDDRQRKGLGKGVVTLVMGRTRKHRASAVAAQHVVSNPHRQLRAVDGIDGVRPGEHAGFGRIGGFFGALTVGAVRHLGAIRSDSSALRLNRDGVDQRMVRCQHNIRAAEQGVRTSREHGNFGTTSTRCRQGKIYVRADRSADPIALHLQRSDWPV